MGNEENGHSLAGQLMQGHEQLFNRLGNEHRRRLVQNQQLRIGHQRANDLHALAFAHRELVDDGGRIDLKAVLLAETLHFGRNGFDRLFFRETERDVFRHGQRVEKGKVLVHHRNAERTGLCRTVDLERTAVEFHAAFVRTDGAVNDLHERGFAGAVFAEHGEHFPGRNVHIDMVVGHDAGVALRDVFQTEAGMHACPRPEPLQMRVMWPANTKRQVLRPLF